MPTQLDSPWPTFRRDERNTGRSPLPARYHGDRPWSFSTGKGIFSTPVIDARGILYVGSGDHVFYAITPDGQEKWRCETGEIIDSAGALPRAESATVVFPSGDGYLRCLRTHDGSVVWALDARVSPRASYNNWFEGNVAIGHDGTLYAGNTNFNYYAVNPDGTLKWTYPTGANNWSIAAIAQDGTLFWGSNDTKVRAVRPDGIEKWSRRTLGFIAASGALGSDGTLYIGSFDSYLYALDSATGKVKWKFKTNDHLYASAALGADADGNTNAVYIGSTDGSLYALTPGGQLRWSYDTGDPIRSSPALGRAPEGETGDILYFGCGNGKLYALNTRDGSRRWSFDTTPDDAELRDRNDLNGSPALGATGVYIGGEHGCLWYVPYDYPLHVADERASTNPAEDLPRDMVKLFYVTPGGSTLPAPSEPLPAATHIALRLIVREHGKTLDARVWNAPFGRPRDALNVSARPAFPFRVEPSADGRYLHIIPDGLLEPGTQYTLDIRGNLYTGGWHIGNLTLGGRKHRRFSESLSFRTAPSSGRVHLAHKDSDRVPAIEWSRLAVPVPTMLPSLNQLGFDYMDWILGTVACTEPDANGQGKLIVWAIGGRTEHGKLRVDPNSDFILPLSGVYRGDAFSLTNRRFTMEITGIPIPFNEFQLRGQLQADGRVRPGATSYAETQVLSIPTFGPYLVIAGLANNWWQKLVAKGTFITRPYHGPANQRPAGLHVAAFDYAAPTRAQAGQVTARFEIERGAAYPLAEHRPAIVLIDEAKFQVVSLDYRRLLSATDDAQGNLASVTLTIPAGTRLPTRLRVFVMADVFPLYEVEIKAKVEEGK